MVKIRLPGMGGGMALQCHSHTFCSTCCQENPVLDALTVPLHLRRAAGNQHATGAPPITHLVCLGMAASLSLKLHMLWLLFMGSIRMAVLDGCLEPRSLVLSAEAQCHFWSAPACVHAASGCLNTSGQQHEQCTGCAVFKQPDPQCSLACLYRMLLAAMTELRRLVRLRLFASSGSPHVCLPAGDTADDQDEPEDLSADEIGRKIASQWTSDPDAAGDSPPHDPQEEGRKAAEAARSALKQVGAALCSPDTQ